MKGMLAIGLLALLLVGACQSNVTSARHVEEAIYDFSWQHRPMILFSPRREDPRLERQIEIMKADKKGFADRDLILITAIGEKASVVFPNDEEFAPGSGADLRGKFGVEPSEFAVVVVGKDVKVKHRWPEPVSAQTLFKALDAR